MAGFVEFFYNIIPGALFLLAISTTFHKFDPDLLQNITAAGDLTKLSVFFIVSLFLGFVFQMLNKLLPPINNLHKKSMEEIAEKNKDDFAEAIKRLKILTGREIILKDNKSDSYEETIYFMHDFLLSDKQNNILELFHTRISLWANTSIASVSYAVILLIASLAPFVSINDSNFYISLSLISIIITISCYFATKKSHKIFYDTLLKTFLVTTGNLISTPTLPNKRKFKVGSSLTSRKIDKK